MADEEKDLAQSKPERDRWPDEPIETEGPVDRDEEDG